MLCMRSLEPDTYKIAKRQIWTESGDSPHLCRQRDNSPMHHSLSPLAAWKPHQRTSAWKHQLKPKGRKMFIRNQSTSWNGIWLKYGQQLAELHWSIDRPVTTDEIVLLRVSKPKANILSSCYVVFVWYVSVMTFKAYTTAVMNKLTLFRFTR